MDRPAATAVASLSRLAYVLRVYKPAHEGMLAMCNQPVCYSEWGYFVKRHHELQSTRDFYVSAHLQYACKRRVSQVLAFY